MKRILKLALIQCIILIVLSISGHASMFISGKVMDYLTRKPIQGAIITANNEVVQTDSNGMFVIRNATKKIGIRACGYARGEQVFPFPAGRTVLKIYLQPFTPKALYLTFYGIGDRSLRESALKLINETELNALVIDVKGDRGVITYKSSFPFASEIGAQKLVIIKDIRSLLQSLRERGIYTIARIVVFKDNILGSARPDLTVRTQDGRVWHDREDLIWVDPSRREVWDYNINIAVEAAQMGFDEIQFDYVRFAIRDTRIQKSCCILLPDCFSYPEKGTRTYQYPTCPIQAMAASIQGLCVRQEIFQWHRNKKPDQSCRGIWLEWMDALESPQCLSAT